MIEKIKTWYWDWKYIDEHNSFGFSAFRSSLLYWWQQKPKIGKCACCSRRVWCNKQQLDNLIASRRAYKPGHPTPPKAGKYTSAQIMKFLDISRQRVSAIAQNRGWVLKDGY